MDINNLVQKVMGEVESTSYEADLLTNCGKWDDNSSSKIFSIYAATQATGTISSYTKRNHMEH